MKNCLQEKYEGRLLLVRKQGDTIPVICRHPAGRFCVAVPMRVTNPAGTTRDVEAAPPLQHEQAA